MWAQDWTNIYDLLEPYKGKTRPDATQGMIEQVISSVYIKSKIHLILLSIKIGEPPTSYTLLFCC